MPLLTMVCLRRPGLRSRAARGDSMEDVRLPKFGYHLDNPVPT